MLARPGQGCDCFLYGGRGYLSAGFCNGWGAGAAADGAGAWAGAWAKAGAAAATASPTPALPTIWRRENGGLSFVLMLCLCCAFGDVGRGNGRTATLLLPFPSG